MIIYPYCIRKICFRQGPVEYVRMNNKDNVIYFNNNIGELVEKIEKYLKKNLDIGIKQKN